MGYYTQHELEIIDGSNNISFDACSVSCNLSSGYKIDSNSKKIKKMYCWLAGRGGFKC